MDCSEKRMKQKALSQIRVSTPPWTFCQRIAHSTDVTRHVKQRAAPDKLLQPNILSHAPRFPIGRSLLVGIRKMETNTAVAPHC